MSSRKKSIYSKSYRVFKNNLSVLLLETCLKTFAIMYIGKTPHLRNQKVIFQLWVLYYFVTNVLNMLKGREFAYKMYIL